MHLSRPLTLSLRLSSRRPSARLRGTVAPVRERNKRANVSEDKALYNCSCGFVFKAAVTTSVGCPHCGTAQAW
jgi:hypothetical protein